MTLKTQLKQQSNLITPIVGFEFELCLPTQLMVDNDAPPDDLADSLTADINILNSAVVEAWGATIKPSLQQHLLKAGHTPGQVKLIINNLQVVADESLPESNEVNTWLEIVFNPMNIHLGQAILSETCAWISKVGGDTTEECGFHINIGLNDQKAIDNAHYPTLLQAFPQHKTLALYKRDNSHHTRPTPLFFKDLELIDVAGNRYPDNYWNQYEQAKLLLQTSLFTETRKLLTEDSATVPVTEELAAVIRQARLQVSQNYPIALTTKEQDAAVTQISRLLQQESIVQKALQKDPKTHAIAARQGKFGRYFEFRMAGNHNYHLKPELLLQTTNECIQAVYTSLLPKDQARCLKPLTTIDDTTAARWPISLASPQPVTQERPALPSCHTRAAINSHFNYQALYLTPARASCALWLKANLMPIVVLNPNLPLASRTMIEAWNNFWTIHLRDAIGIDALAQDLSGLGLALGILNTDQKDVLIEKLTAASQAPQKSSVGLLMQVMEITPTDLADVLDGSIMNQAQAAEQELSWNTLGLVFKNQIQFDLTMLKRELSVALELVVAHQLTHLTFGKYDPNGARVSHLKHPLAEYPLRPQAIHLGSKYELYLPGASNVLCIHQNCLNIAQAMIDFGTRKTKKAEHLIVNHSRKSFSP